MIEGKGSLAFVGTGTMAEAIMRGVLASGVLAPERITVTNRHPSRVDALIKEHGVQGTTDNVAAMAGCAVAIVGVKPWAFAQVLDHDEARSALKGKIVISVAAGLPCAQLAAWLPESKIIRVMPNTPSLIGQGMSGIVRGPGADDEAVATATRIFFACGLTVELEEAKMDAFTALAGSGPAFIFAMIEGLADGGVRMGLKRDVAIKTAAQMVQGSANMLLKTGKHPGVLKDQVTTPGGCTIAGLLHLEDGGMRGLFARAVEETAKAAAAMGKK